MKNHRDSDFINPQFRMFFPDDKARYACGLYHLLGLVVKGFLKIFIV